MIRIFILTLLASACVNRTTDSAWDEPLLGDETAGASMLPLFSSPGPDYGRQLTDKRTLRDREKKLYWQKSPGPESESRAWKKNFKKRLDAFSRRWVLSPFLPMHRKPSQRSEVVGQLLQGDTVWVQAINENWARLRSGAWVPAKKLSTVPPDPFHLQRPASQLHEEDLLP